MLRPLYCPWLLCVHHSCFTTIWTLKPSSHSTASSSSPALPIPPSPPFFQLCTSTDSTIYSALYATPPPPVSLSLSLLFPSLSSSWELALSFSVEVGHWVNSTEHDVINKATGWVRSGKAKKAGKAGRTGDVKGLKVEKNWVIQNEFARRYHAVRPNTWCGNE